MPKLTLNILKNSILPAALLVVGKLLGLFISINIYGLDMYISNEIKGMYSIQIYSLDANQTLLANSFSNAFMLGLIFLVGMFFLIKYQLEVNAKSDPRTLVRLIQLNLYDIVTKSEIQFVKVFVWVAFMSVASLIVLTSSITATTYSFIGIIALALLIFVIWWLVKTFEQEIARMYPKDNLYT